MKFNIIYSYKFLKILIFTNLVLTTDYNIFDHNKYNLQRSNLINVNASSNCSDVHIDFDVFFDFYDNNTNIIEDASSNSNILNFIYESIESEKYERIEKDRIYESIENLRKNSIQDDDELRNNYEMVKINLKENIVKDDNEDTIEDKNLNENNDLVKNILLLCLCIILMFICVASIMFNILIIKQIYDF